MHTITVDVNVIDLNGPCMTRAAIAETGITVASAAPTMAAHQIQGSDDLRSSAQFEQRHNANRTVPTGPLPIGATPDAAPSYLERVERKVDSLHRITEQDVRAADVALAQAQSDLAQYKQMGLIGRLLNPGESRELRQKFDHDIAVGQTETGRIEADTKQFEVITEALNSHRRLPDAALAVAPAAPQAPLIHRFDIYPEHPGDELTIRENGAATSEFVRSLQADRSTTCGGLDLKSAAVTAVTELQKFYGKYNQNEEKAYQEVNKYNEGADELAKEGLAHFLVRCVRHPIDTWNNTIAPMNRENAAAKREQYATKDPDELGRDSLDCAQQAPLVSIALQQLGNFPHQLCHGEIYASAEDIPRKESQNHVFIYVPANVAGNSFGNIVEATTENADDALKTIVAVASINGRDFWVTHQGRYYRKTADLRETAID